VPSKLLRGNTKIVAVDYEAIADPTAPTSDELNSAEFAYDISCAILDDYSLNSTDSDTDDTLTICDIGNVQTPTFRNYEGDLTGLKDQTLTDNTSVYNTFFHLFMAPGVKYWLVKRIGPAQATAFAAGDVVSLYLFETDYPTNNADDGSMLSMTANLKPAGAINLNYTLLA
jgi:hypothetical protein